MLHSGTAMEGRDLVNSATTCRRARCGVVHALVKTALVLFRLRLSLMIKIKCNSDLSPVFLVSI